MTPPLKPSSQNSLWTRPFDDTQQSHTAPFYVIWGSMLATVFTLSHPVFSFGFLGTSLAGLTALTGLLFKRTTTAVAVAVSAVASVAGFATGATLGHFHEQATAAQALQAQVNAKKYAQVPVVRSVTKAFKLTAPELCADSTTPTLPFPNGETRKEVTTATGSKAFVICQPARP